MFSTPTTILALLGSIVALAAVYQLLTAPNSIGLVNSASSGFGGLLRAATGKSQ